MDTEAKIENLKQAGLSKDQATLYMTLLVRGKITASKLQPHTALSRPMVYKVLDELVTLGLVVKDNEKQAVSKFESAHPIKLRELIDSQKNLLENKHQALEGALSSLISDYTARSKTPGVRMLKGIRGIEELYEDILNENRDICLVRSPYDDGFPELVDRVITQIENQVKLGIKTRAITPFDNETTKELEETDPKNLVERKLVSLEHLDLPAQILLYGDKVAITAFDTELMTTIIQNQAISSTFSIMFEFMWRALEAEDSRIRSGLKTGEVSAPRPRL